MYIHLFRTSCKEYHLVVSDPIVIAAMVKYVEILFGGGHWPHDQATRRHQPKIFKMDRNDSNPLGLIKDHEKIFFRYFWNDCPASGNMNSVR